jgi:hypothetical protein
LQTQGECLMVGRKPEKKPFGRSGPPRSYPRDQSVYADPENWRYPLHTPWHAKAARRYFDDQPSRVKYTEEEQVYIDWRINAALKKFESRQGRRSSPRISMTKNVNEMSLKQLMHVLLGSARLKRATEIDDSLVTVTSEAEDRIEAKVKDYHIEIDLKNQTVLHDCQDWRNNMASKNMCKHLGKLLLTLKEAKAIDICRNILKHKNGWKFTAPES